MHERTKTFALLFFGLILGSSLLVSIYKDEIQVGADDLIICPPLPSNFSAGHYLLQRGSDSDFYATDGKPILQYSPGNLQFASVALTDNGELWALDSQSYSQRPEAINSHPIFATVGGIRRANAFIGKLPPGNTRVFFTADGRFYTVHPDQMLIRSDADNTWKDASGQYACTASLPSGILSTITTLDYPIQSVVKLEPASNYPAGSPAHGTEQAVSTQPVQPASPPTTKSPLTTAAPVATKKAASSPQSVVSPIPTNSSTPSVSVSVQSKLAESATNETPWYLKIWQWIANLFQ